MKLRILVIDDEATASGHTADRKSTYQSLSGRDGGIEVTFALSPAEAQALIQKETYDVVMLDVWLKNEPFVDDDSGTVFQELFLAASTQSMVALVSSNWDNTVVPRVNQLLVKNPGIPVPLMLSFEELRKNHHAAVSMQLQAEIRRRRGGLSLEIGDDQTLQIVHISDLHFGSKYATETLAGEANLDALASALIRAIDGQPHILAITGDISNTGHPDEYKEAYAWLKKLCRELGMSLPNRRILLVPGNHDFSLPVALSMKLQATPDPSGGLTFVLGEPSDSSRKLSRYATRGFADFAELVTGMPSSPEGRFDRCWVDTAFREYGVLFSGINTCGRVKDDAWPDRWFDQDDAMKIVKATRELHTQSLFHVMLSHHPPVRTPNCREPIANADEFSNLFFQTDDCRPHLILHGHEHARRGDMPWADKVLVVCAPTPSVRERGRPPDSLRGLNLVGLERQGGRVERATARSLVFEGGRWKALELGPHSTVGTSQPKTTTARRPSRSSRAGNVSIEKATPKKKR